jgi:hypothetical protein
MHGLESMTREKLLELAPLDAFGLLDEVEAALFHRAFHEAPVSLQAEVVALQAELAAADHFLADEEPRPILRRKVLLRLEEVMDESTEGLQPIAHIGQIGSRDSEAAAPSAGEENRLTPERLAEFRMLMEEFTARNARAAERSTPFWRAAAIVLGSALVVSLYTLGQTSGQATKIAQQVISQGVEQQIGLLVPNVSAFSAVEDRTFPMAPVDARHRGLASAILLVDSVRGQVVVAAFGLGRIGQGGYSLKAVDRDGRSAEIVQLAADRFLAGAAGALPKGFEPIRYELLGPDGAVAFTVETAMLAS